MNYSNEKYSAPLLNLRAQNLQNFIRKRHVSEIAIKQLEKFSNNCAKQLSKKHSKYLISNNSNIDLQCVN